MDPEGGVRSRRAPEGRTTEQPHQRYRLHMVHLMRRPETEISCCVKYMIFGFNVLFWLLGLAVFFVGVWAKLEKTAVSQLAEMKKFYIDPAWFFIIVGFITFVICFSGCVGALRENTCLLASYGALLGILLLTQISVAILGFVFKDGLKDQLEGQLDHMIVYYREDPDLQSVIDWIQDDWLQCCGIKTPDDWDMNIYFNKSSEALGSPEAGGVPFSCCVSTQESLANLYCGHGVRMAGYKGSSDYHRVGCLEKFQQWLQRNVMGVGITLVVIAVFEILGICFAQNLRSDIFAQRARWQYER